MYSFTDLHVTITNLKPFTNYGFLVAGVTGAGRGVLSDIIFHRTGEGSEYDSDVRFTLR